MIYEFIYRDNTKVVVRADSIFKARERANAILICQGQGNLVTDLVGYRGYFGTDI